VAACPEIGTASQGHTEEEALANLHWGPPTFTSNPFHKLSGNQQQSALLNWHMAKLPIVQYDDSKPLTAGLAR